jgi:hypothetical protein
VSRGVYYAATGSRWRTLGAVAAVSVVAGGAIVFLAMTRPWLPPEEADDASAGPVRRVAPVSGPSRPAATAEDVEEAPVEPNFPAARSIPAEPTAPPIVFVEAFACRAVESNTTFLAVSWQATLGISSPEPARDLSAEVAVLDPDGFVLDEMTVYHLQAIPGGTNQVQERILVSYPKAGRVASCKMSIRSSGTTLDSREAAIEMAVQPPKPRQDPIRTSSAPRYTAPRPAATGKLWGDPKVHRYGSRAVVSFRIWNPGQETITANVDVELYLNGEFISSEGDLVEVAPGDKRLLEVTFDGVGQGGKATASVRIQ